MSQVQVGVREACEGASWCCAVWHCERWFRSRDGLAVHRCRRDQVEEESDQTGGMRSDKQIVCRVCGRAFRRQGDLKRHKCLSEREKPVEEQQGTAQCAVCRRWFRSAGGLAVHKRVHTREPREVPNASRVPNLAPSLQRDM